MKVPAVKAQEVPYAQKLRGGTKREEGRRRVAGVTQENAMWLTFLMELARGMALEIILSSPLSPCGFLEAWDTVFVKVSLRRCTSGRDNNPLGQASGKSVNDADHLDFSALSAGDAWLRFGVSSVVSATSYSAGATCSTREPRKISFAD